MLLVRTCVKPSNQVKGLGLFAEEAIPQGTPIFKFDLRVDRKYLRHQVLGLPLAQQAYLYSFMWRSKTSNMYCMFGDIAGYMNHSHQPNITVTFPHDAERYGLEHEGVSARNIYTGQELFWDYTLFDSIDLSDGNLWDTIRKNFPLDDQAFIRDDVFDNEFYVPAIAAQQKK